jgi:hypothetical protein
MSGTRKILLRDRQSGMDAALKVLWSVPAEAEILDLVRTGVLDEIVDAVIKSVISHPPTHSGLGSAGVGK